MSETNGILDDRKIRTLLHQQEILEKNFKIQLREETKRRKTLVESLRNAEKQINDLGKIITEKDKLINRLNIYSRGRTLPQLKHSELSSSTPNNLNLFDDESVVTRLDKKLKDLELKRNNVVLEKVESPPTLAATDQVKTRIPSSKTRSSSENRNSRTGRQLTSNQKAKRLSSLDRKKALVQEEVDRNVVIKNMQEKLPDISKQKPEINNNLAESEHAVVVKKVDAVSQLEASNVNANDEASESVGSEDSNERVELNNATPDLVPKSFQDKRKFFENLGPIKIKHKKKSKASVETESMSAEEKIGFWLPATPPSQREEDIFVGKKFDKPPKQVKFKDEPQAA